MAQMCSLQQWRRKLVGSVLMDTNTQAFVGEIGSSLKWTLAFLDLIVAEKISNVIWGRGQYVDKV